MSYLCRFLNAKGIHGLIVRFAPKALKKIAFDAKFAEGGWLTFADTKNPEFISRIEHYAKNGNICILGCGGGGIADKLSPSSYRSFIGIDLSSVAIASARKRETHKVKFFEGDFMLYAPAERFSVVVFEECIIYLNKTSLLGAINKYLNLLDDDGVIMIQTSQAHKHRAMLTAIRNNFGTIEDRFLNTNKHLFVLGGREDQESHRAASDNIAHSTKPVRPSIPRRYFWGNVALQH